MPAAAGPWADTMVMHPVPIIRGLEISAEAADSPQSLAHDQVAGGVSKRMAALFPLLSGDREVN